MFSCAQEAFDQIEQEGLAPNNYSYSNLINAYINSGEVHEADAIFAKMKVREGGPCGALSQHPTDCVVVAPSD